MSITFPVGNQKSHIHTIQISDQTIIFRILPLCVLLWLLNSLKTNQREDLKDHLPSAAILIILEVTWYTQLSNVSCKLEWTNLILVVVFFSICCVCRQAGQ